MKIYNKVVMDIDTFEILEEDSFEYDGEIALLKGGGSVAGTIDYPAYIKEIHSDWLANTNPSGTDHETIAVGGDITSLINTGLAADSPYTYVSRPSSAIAYDPDTYLTAIQTQYNSFETEAESLNESTNWGAYMNTVINKLDNGTTFPNVDILGGLSNAVSDAITAANIALASAPITNIVNGYENEQLIRFKRSVSRFSASMAEVNAVQTTSFAMGLALMESEFNNDVNRFEAQLKFETYRNILHDSVASHVQAELVRSGVRDNMISGAVKDITNLLNIRVNSLKDASILLNEINKAAIIAKKEEQDFNLELDVREATWDLELFQMGGNIMASAPGGIGSSAKQSPSQAAASNALAIASIISSVAAVA